MEARNILPLINYCINYNLMDDEDGDEVIETYIFHQNSKNTIRIKGFSEYVVPKYNLSGKDSNYLFVIRILKPFYLQILKVTSGLFNTWDQK